MRNETSLRDMNKTMCCKHYYKTCNDILFPFTLMLEYCVSRAWTQNRTEAFTKITTFCLV